MRTGIITPLPRQVAPTKGALGSKPPLPGKLFNLSEPNARLRTRGLVVAPGHNLSAGDPTVEHGAASTVLAATVLTCQPGPGLRFITRCGMRSPALGHPDFGSARPGFVRARHDTRQALEEIAS